MVILDFARDISKFRDLLYMLTWRDIRIKYKQSIMGILWAVLMPLIIVCAGVLVRYAFSRLSETPLELRDAATVAVKSVPWAFVVSGIRFCTTSLIGNASLVTKIYLPRELFPLSATLSQFFDFSVASAALTVILGLAGIGASVQLLWVPLLCVLLFLLVFSLGTMLSALGLFFRDVKYIVEVMLTFAIFFTPVFYEVSLFDEWAPLLLLNPVAPVLEAFNATVILHQAPDAFWLGYSAAFALLAFYVSMSTFKKLEPMFAESI